MKGASAPDVAWRCTAFVPGVEQVGTGGGGGTLAAALAPSGKRILLLERGDYVPREQDNWNPRAVNVDANYHTKEIWGDTDGKPLHPRTNYCVGATADMLRYTLHPFPPCCVQDI